MKRGLVFGVGMTGAVVLSDFVLYRTLIVPRLADWRSVPLFWWALVAMPVAIAIIVAGSLARGLKDILSSSAVATVLTTFYAAWAAQQGQPGHLKSFTAESPSDAWLLGPGVALVAFVLLLGTTHWFANVVRRAQHAG
jgi:hypothetical protein